MTAAACAARPAARARLLRRELMNISQPMGPRNSTMTIQPMRGLNGQVPPSVPGFAGAIPLDSAT